MPGILEDLADRMLRLEQSVEAVAELVRSPDATSVQGVPLAESEQIWSAGAMDLAAAEEFSGISRRELYELMRSGELPYCQPTRERLVPRLWLIRYLASLRNPTGRTKSA